MTNYSLAPASRMLHAPLELECLTDAGGNLTLVLSDAENRRVEIRFDSHVAYRKMDEGDALLTLSELAKAQALESPIVRVGGSEFLAWFNRERAVDHDDGSITHYLVIAANDLIDVLSSQPPEVTV